MVLATDKTNSTTSSNDHPAHHNALAVAVNAHEVALTNMSAAVFNVLDYGADPTGAVEATTAFAAAVAAAGAVSPLGIVYVPRGYYTIDKVNITNGVSFIGDGVGPTYIAAKSGATGPLLNFAPSSYMIDQRIGGFYLEMVNAPTIVAMYFTKTSNATLDDIKINRGSVGIDCNELAQSWISRLQVGNQTTACIRVNGDLSAENHWVDNHLYAGLGGVTVAAALEITATGPSPGGNYFDRLRVNWSAGTLTRGVYVHSSVANSDMFLWFTDCFVDYCTAGSALELVNVSTFRSLDCWWLNDHATAYAVKIDGGSDLRFLGTHFKNANAAAGGMEFANAPDQITLIGSSSDNGTALKMGTYPLAPTNLSMRGNDFSGASAICNNMGDLAASGVQQTDLGMEILTHGGGGAGPTFSIRGETGKRKYFRVLSTGSLQILKDDFSSQSMLLTDAGAITIPDDLDAAGGYRQTIDGWFIENVGGSTASTALTRLATTTDNPNAWIAPRAGSVTALLVHTNDARTAGTLTATVFKNGSGIALTAVLDGTNTTFKTTTSAKDALTFAAGDRLDVRYATSSFTPTTADIRAAIEVET